MSLSSLIFHLTSKKFSAMSARRPSPHSNLASQDLCIKFFNLMSFGGSRPRGSNILLMSLRTCRFVSVSGENVIFLICVTLKWKMSIMGFHSNLSVFNMYVSYRNSKYSLASRHSGGNDKVTCGSYCTSTFSHWTVLFSRCFKACLKLFCFLLIPCSSSNVLHVKVTLKCFWGFSRNSISFCEFERWTGCIKGVTYDALCCSRLTVCLNVFNRTESPKKSIIFAVFVVELDWLTQPCHITTYSNFEEAEPN